MVWLPTERLLVVMLATPVGLRGPLPREEAPSEKLTVPVGVPLAVVTVAVKVTVWPETEGLAEDARVVVVTALLTCWVRPALVLLVKLASPP